VNTNISDIMNIVSHTPWIAKPVPVALQRWPADALPLVSICCITYNQARYIRDCLDGFFAQETRFPVEILIHDDASTDDTAEIIREYDRRFPGVIRPIYQIENQYSKNVRINAVFNFPRVKGKYIAYCEGDDFWHSVEKLQTQVEFMEVNPGLSSCFHNVLEFHEAKNTANLMFDKPLPDVCKLEEIATANRVPMLSVLFRAHLFPAFPEWYYRMPIGDWPLHVLNAEHGDIGYMDNVFATYRVHGGGVWSRLSEIDAFRTNITVAMAIDKHLGHRFSNAICKNIAYWNYRIAINMLKDGAKKGVLSHLIGALRCEHDEIPRQNVYRLLFKTLAPGIYWRWERVMEIVHRR